MKVKILTITTIASAAIASSASANIIALQAGVGGQPADIIEEAMLVQNQGNDNWGGRDNFETGVTGNGQVRTTVMRFNVTDPSLGLFVAGVPQFSSINSISLTLTHHATTNLNPANMDVRVSAAVESQGDWVEGIGTVVGSTPDAGTVTYTERREGEGTGWSPDTNYTRGTGAELLSTVTTWPGLGNTATFNFSSSDLTALVNSWVTGNNEGVLINDVGRTGFARWVFDSSEAATAANRPQLTIDYTPIPEPSGAIVLGLSSLGLLLRRRR